MAKSLSLLDDIKNRPSRPEPRTWLTRLPAKAQQELQALKAAWKAGEIDKPASVVYAAMTEAYPQITVRATEIRKWLNG